MFILARMQTVPLMPVTTHSDLSTGAGVGVGGAEVVDVGGTVEAGVVDVVGGKGVVVGGGAGSSVVARGVSNFISLKCFSQD